MTVSALVQGLINIIDNLQNALHVAEKARRQIRVRIIQAILFTTGLALVAGGSIVYFARFFSLEAILLTAGLTMIVIALFLNYMH